MSVKISKTYPHICISNQYPLDIQDLSTYPHIQTYPDMRKISKNYPHIHISNGYPSGYLMDTWIYGYPFGYLMDISWISYGYLFGYLFWISIPVFWICKPQEKNRYPYIHISMTYPWLIHDLSTYPYISVHIQCGQVPRWSGDGQLEILKGAEENQVEPEIIWACLVTASLWYTSTLWA